MDYRLESVSLSKQDIDLIRALQCQDVGQVVSLASEHGFIRTKGDALQMTREGRELEVKLARMGMLEAWLNATSKA